MKDVIVNFQTYRIFKYMNKVIVEFDAEIRREDDTVDVLKKQLVVTENSNEPFENVVSLAEFMMADWQMSQVEG
jgi:hypothetical protein